MIFYPLKAGYKFFIFNSIQAAKDFFQIKFLVEIVGYDKYNLIVIFSLKFWLKYFCKTVIYEML